MKNKIILFSLPNFNTVYMPLAVPYLTGYLRKNGFDVIQRDLNIMAYDFFLTEKYLRRCIEKLKWKNSKEYRQVAKHIEGAKNSMRDLRAYGDFSKFSKNKKILEKAFDIICGASEESFRIRGNTFEYEPGEYYKGGGKISYKSRQGLLKSIENRKDSVFYEFFKKQIIPFLKREKPVLIGISIFDQKQLVVAFILSSLIKEFRTDAKIVLGGNIITRVCDILSGDDPENRELFKYIDFAVHHEGEVSLAKLAKELLSENPRFDKVPKLIRMKGGEIIANPEFNITDLNEIPPPDFDGFDANLHWTPRPVISYLTKRGCPHHCAFCDTPFGYDGYRGLMEAKTGKKFKITGRRSAARHLSIGRIIKEIKYLKNKYQSTYFSFADEELLSPFLKIFCRKLIEENIDITWECFARMESDFKDKDFCDLLARAGCAFLQFGLESVSQKVLDYENKKTKVSDYPVILRNTFEAGIMNQSFFLIGTPSDNLFEAIKILAFLEKYGKYIYTIRPIIYKTSKWSLNAFSAASKGLTINENAPDLDIHRDMWGEKPKFGMSFDQARLIVKILELWVRYRHKVNPVTRTYIYAQRLFVGPKLIGEFSKKAKPEKMEKSLEKEILTNFSEILKTESGNSARISRRNFIREGINKEFSDFESLDEKNRRGLSRKFSRLYDSEEKRRLFLGNVHKSLKSRNSPLALNEVIDFSKKLQEIDGPPAF